jgi:hypothetical protein
MKEEVPCFLRHRQPLVDEQQTHTINVSELMRYVQLPFTTRKRGA